MDLVGTYIKTISPRYDDDAVDLVHNYFTALILSVLAALLTVRQFVGNPIKCWAPADFTKAWIQYAEYQCFVENTYFIPLDESLPEEQVHRESKEIGYYQ
jgi:innexin